MQDLLQSVLTDKLTYFDTLNLSNTWTKHCTKSNTCVVSSVHSETHCNN